MKRQKKFIIAFGGNANSDLGSPDETILFAHKALAARGAVILKESRLFRTPAFPAGAGPDFVNSAALIRANHSPDDMLDLLHQIEAESGRVREVRWGARTLDIDLIAQDETVLPNEAQYRYWQSLDLSQQQVETPGELILPHPRLQDRAFVLIPLLDIVPDWVHPVSGLSVAEMVANLPKSEREEVIAL
ncbi:2-amino-4-hydroxy-6-hydroxymethyldihydropteridine diphosphokinase [Cognatishimia sp. WU-CL00825]|uniref:2-amino-4-hydroxy-6- hydroxymethyldihydropteridine diphosphokinase n=1 Tax=Cognatishimia sp. WU-CL00825 TaxID=3127658 RepID=UPI00310B09B3